MNETPQENQEEIEMTRYDQEEIDLLPPTRSLARIRDENYHHSTVNIRK